MLHPHVVIFYILIFFFFVYFSAKWNNGLNAKVNDYVDKTISMIVPFMQENGLDPMELPDIEEGFEVVCTQLLNRI